MQPHPHESMFLDIRDKIRDLVPAKLITITFSDFEASDVFRVFSTIPEVFPVSGRKKMNRQGSADWVETIFKNQQCYSILRVRDYPEHFYDYEIIEGLGLISALCVPIIDSDNKTIGSVNILDMEGAYINAPESEIIDTVRTLSSVYQDCLHLSK